MIRAHIDAWLRQRWYGGQAPGLGLRMLERVYAGIAQRRRRHFLRQPPRRCQVPVVVVGNLVAGGSGKTPLCAALLEALRARGWRPGLASRGYGRRGQAGLWVEPDGAVDRTGDEPLLLARTCGVPVRVDVDRVAAVRALAERGCDVVICDDGLQHYRLWRDVEIEVSDAGRGYGNGHLLPAGPLREAVARAAACDFRVCQVTPERFTEGLAENDVYSLCLRPRALRPLAGGAELPLSAFAGRRVHAVAGIGHPDRFFATLRGNGLIPCEHPFPDHHRFRVHELVFSESLPIVTTGKDALRWPESLRHDAYELRVEVQISPALVLALDKRLRQCQMACAS